MKKKLSLFLMLACILSLFTGTALAEKLESSEAENMIYALIEANLNCSRDQLTTHQLVYDKNTGIWAMSALLIDCPQDEDGLFVVEMNNSGNIAGELKASEKISLFVQLRKELFVCTRREDCYLLMAELLEKWKPRLDAMQAEADLIEPRADRVAVEQKYLMLVRLDLTTPAEGSLPIDQAYDLAVAYAAEQPNWSQEKVNTYRLHMNAYYTPEDIGKPVYFFQFETPEYTDKNVAKLKKLFGETYPLSISLMVDAVDGSLVETPIQEFPGDPFYYLDFLIRTDEVIEAGKAGTQ
ncbi:MAG: hypothetical protein GX096_00850 [Clostridiales bacterium]|nr:hypothetical protein [Clostridiales bacterium]